MSTELAIKDLRIPSLPAVAMRVLEAVKDEKHGFENLSRIISSDPALTAKTLSLVNSPFYGLSQSISDLKQAIAILGTETIKNIALSFVITKSFTGNKNSGFDYEYFWQRAITAAVAAEILKNRIGLSQDIFFTSALLMDLGIIVMYLSQPKAYLRVLDLKRARGGCICGIEKEIFGIDHQAVTAEVLRQWSIPNDIVSLVEDHHTLKEDDIKGSVLYVANLASSLYHGGQTGQKHARLKELMTRLYRITDHDFDTFVDDVATQAREIFSVFEIPQGSIKPYSELLQEANEELRRLNLTYEQMVVELKKAKEKAETLAKKLMDANEKLRELALKDGLTGLYNHRYFQEILEKELHRARRYEQPISIIMIDIDYFKKINDTYGHQQGDLVLREISSIIKASLRDSDIAARYGGEEFAIILPQTGPKGALACAQRLRQSVEALEFRLNEQPVKVTISLGVASAQPSKKDIPKALFIELADKALYHSKKSGRNRVSAIDVTLNQKRSS